MPNIHIIADRYEYAKFNLVNMDTGKCLLPQWSSSISEIRAGAENGSLYCVSYYNYEHPQESKASLVNEKGRNVLGFECNSLQLWEENCYGRGLILKVRVKGSTGYRLYSVKKKKFLTEEYVDIKLLRCFWNEQIRVFRKGGKKYVFTLLSWPGAKPYTDKWFEAISFDHPLYKSHCFDKDFVACVKYKNRYHVLHKDGSLDIPK